MKHALRSSGFVSFIVVMLFGASLAFGLADRRFDVATIQNNADGSDPHFSYTNLAHLNFASTNGHILCNSTDANRLTYNAVVPSNYQAAYYNDMQSLFSGGYNADQAGDQIENWLVANFSTTGTPPQWVVLNEISRGAWDANTVNSAGIAYRVWVPSMCARLNSLYGRAVIIFSPYILPTINGPAWTAVSDHAYIAIESHLSGSQVNGSGNSVSWCQGQYQPYVNAYHTLGVPYAKIYLTEYYNNSLAGDAYGRSGVSYAGWDNAIKTRASAIHNIFTAGQIGGYISYDWASNAMHVSEADQCHFEDTYASKQLP